MIASSDALEWVSDLGSGRGGVWLRKAGFGRRLGGEFSGSSRLGLLGPSSFNYIPSKMIHQAWLPDDGLVFITVDSAWDINWVDGPPAPPKEP